ncbi:MAG: KR domain-containing protein, partial [Mycobacterium sp.]
MNCKVCSRFIVVPYSSYGQSATDVQRLLEFAAGLLVHPPDMLRHVHIGGKTALLTGATGGLGRVIAKALAARGATLVLSSRK